MQTMWVRLNKTTIKKVKVQPVIHLIINKQNV